MDRKELAEKYFNDGYTCSQAVVLAFKDLLDVDGDKLLRMVLPLGGGLGRLRLTCGALSSMAVVVGYLFADSEKSSKTKGDVYAMVQELSRRFIAENGSLNCAELLEKYGVLVEKSATPEARTSDYYKARPCGKIVYNAAKVLEEFLIEKNIIE